MNFTANIIGGNFSDATQKELKAKATAVPPPPPQSGDATQKELKGSRSRVEPSHRTG